MEEFEKIAEYLDPNFVFKLLYKIPKVGEFIEIVAEQENRTQLLILMAYMGIINFQGAGYKPSPLGGNVFSKYFPWPNIGDIMTSKSYSEGKPWEKNVIDAVRTQQQTSSTTLCGKQNIVIEF